MSDLLIAILIYCYLVGLLLVNIENVAKTFLARRYWRFKLKDFFFKFLGTVPWPLYLLTKRGRVKYVGYFRAFKEEVK